MIHFRLIACFKSQSIFLKFIFGEFLDLITYILDVCFAGYSVSLSFFFKTNVRSAVILCIPYTLQFILSYILQCLDDQLWILTDYQKIINYSSNVFVLITSFPHPDIKIFIACPKSHIT